MQHNIPNPDAFALRAELRRRARELTENLARLTAVKNERDAARAAIDDITRKDAEALANWASSGARGEPPVSDPKGRTAAAQKLAAAEAQAAAVDQAIEKLTQQHGELHAELQRVGREILDLRAQHLGRLLTDITARRRELEDERTAADGLAARIQAQLFATDPRTGGDVTSELEAMRVSWLGTRGAQIDAAIAERWADLAKDFPA